MSILITMGKLSKGTIVLTMSDTAQKLTEAQVKYDINNSYTSSARGVLITADGSDGLRIAMGGVDAENDASPVGHMLPDGQSIYITGTDIIKTLSFINGVSGSGSPSLAHVSLNYDGY